MYYRIPELIPIQLQAVAEFAAPDPWNGSAPAQWMLSVYRMTADTNRNLYAAYSAEKQLEWADGQNLDRDDVLGIRSSADGLYHILPTAILRLWQQGRVANALLPGLIATVESRLGRRDFFDPVAGQAWRRYMANGMIGFGVFLACVGVWRFLTGSGNDTYDSFALWFWLCLGAIPCLAGLVLLWWLLRKQNKIAAQVMEFAALLPGGVGVFPGRPA